MYISCTFVDCTKWCATGYLNKACDACICTNITLRGTVKSQDGILLGNATVALFEFPFNILASTNVAGHFELKGICVSQEDFIVERNGYLPQTLNAKKIDTISFTISASLEATGNKAFIFLQIFKNILYVPVLHRIFSFVL